MGRFYDLHKQKYSATPEPAPAQSGGRFYELHKQAHPIPGGALKRVPYEGAPLGEGSMVEIPAPPVSAPSPSPGSITGVVDPFATAETETLRGGRRPLGVAMGMPERRPEFPGDLDFEDNYAPFPQSYGGGEYPLREQSPALREKSLAIAPALPLLSNGEIDPAHQIAPVSPLAQNAFNRGIGLLVSGVGSGIEASGVRAGDTPEKTWENYGRMFLETMSPPGITLPGEQVMKSPLDAMSGIVGPERVQRIGRAIAEYGQKEQEKFPRSKSGEKRPTLKDLSPLADVDWWVENGLEMAPMSGAFVAGTLALSKLSPAVLQHMVGAGLAQAASYVVATVLPALANAFLESGFAYEEAAKTKGKKEAARIAQEVAQKNAPWTLLTGSIPLLAASKGGLLPKLLELVMEPVQELGEEEISKYATTGEHLTTDEVVQIAPLAAAFGAGSSVAAGMAQERAPASITAPMEPQPARRLPVEAQFPGAIDRLKAIAAEPAKAPATVPPIFPDVAQPAPIAQPEPQAADNPYLRMPIERVREDAGQGVVKAVEALKQREGEAQAARPTEEPASITTPVETPSMPVETAVEGEIASKPAPKTTEKPVTPPALRGVRNPPLVYVSGYYPSLEKIYQKRRAFQRKGEKAPGKQPWEMTRDEYIPQHMGEYAQFLREKSKEPGAVATESMAEAAQRAADAYADPQKRPLVMKGQGDRVNAARAQHERVVREALGSGKPVPDAVLADYPELQKGEAQPAPAPEPEGTEIETPGKGEKPVASGREAIVERAEEKPPEKPQESAPASTSGATYRVTDKGLVEVKFAKRPSREVLQRLKGSDPKFGWIKSSGVWRARRTDATEALARELAGEQEKPSVEPANETKKPQFVDYSPGMDIRNIEILSGGSGAPFLLAVRGEGDSFVAKAWKRNPPERLEVGEMLIKMPAQKPLSITEPTEAAAEAPRGDAKLAARLRKAANRTDEALQKRAEERKAPDKEKPPLPPEIIAQHSAEYHGDWAGYMTDAEAGKGYPQALDRLRAYSNDELQKEAAKYTKASFDVVLGQNAKKALNLVHQVIGERKRILFEATGSIRGSIRAKAEDEAKFLRILDRAKNEGIEIPDNVKDGGASAVENHLANTLKERGLRAMKDAEKAYARHFDAMDDDGNYKPSVFVGRVREWAEKGGNPPKLVHGSKTGKPFSFPKRTYESIFSPSSKKKAQEVANQTRKPTALVAPLNENDIPFGYTFVIELPTGRTPQKNPTSVEATLLDELLSGPLSRFGEKSLGGNVSYFYPSGMSDSDINAISAVGRYATKSIPPSSGRRASPEKEAAREAFDRETAEVEDEMMEAQAKRKAEEKTEPTSPADNIGYDYPNFKAAADEWLEEQTKNVYVSFYFYFKPSKGATPGRIGIFSAPPGGDWQIADAQRVQPSWTKEQVERFLDNKSKMLSVLPVEETAEKPAAKKEEAPAFKRTTPAKGTLEREVMDARYAEMNKANDLRSDKIDAVQKDIDKSRSGTKKESALQKKKDKLLETPSPFMTDEGKALKEQLYRAYLEDVVEGAEGVTASDEANRIAARAKLAGSKDAELEAYETLKKLTQDEAERQGVDPDEVESVSLSAASLLSQTPGHYTLEDRVNLEARDLMRRRGEVDRAEKKTETKPQQAAVILERENVVEAPGEPPAEADFILRPPIPDEEEAAIKAMKGTKGKVQPKDMGGKDSTNPVPATIYDGIFAVHKRAGKKGSVVTHIKTGLSVGGIYDNEDAAKGVVYNLLKTDMNWNFTEKPLFTKAEQEKAGDIFRRFGFGNAKESGVPENTIFFFGSGSGRGRGSETRPDYEDAYNILRNIAKEDADFKRDPVMTVTAAGDGWMTLEWRKDAPKEGGKRFYRIKVPVFETERDVLPQPGQAVRISEHWFDTALSPTEARRKFSVTDIPGELAPLEGVGRLEVLRFADTSLYDLYDAIRTRKQETSPHAYEDPELEARDLKNQGVERPSISKRLADFGERVWNRMSREYEHLGRGGEFSRLRFDLTRLQKQFTVSGSKAVERMDKTLSDLSRDDYDLFRRKVILDDLMYEVDEGRLTDDRRINGFGPEDVRREAARINEKVGENKAVHEAIQKRKQNWNKIKADYIKAMEDIGFNVRDRFNNPAYFRHQVLEYINAKGLYGTGKKLKTPTGRGFLKKREGGNYDMNSDYLQSEYEVMSQMIYDIEVARTIKSVDDNYNIQEQLKARARSQNTENVMNIFRERAKDVEPTKADLEEAGPKGDVTEIIARKMYRMALNKKQAMGFKRLQDALARWEDERSPVPSDGRFDGLFEDLAVAREEAEAANADAAEMGMPAGVATVDVSDENQPLLFPYLAWLMKERRDTDAGRAAALIFKGMSEKRQFTKKELTKLGQYKTWQDLVPEGYVVWQPREGNMFYYAYSVPEIVAAQLGEGGMEKIGLTPDQIRKVMAVGGRRREFVVKEEVAATLDAMTKERPDSPAYRASRLAQRTWKQWILLGPRRLFKYNVRNLSGDGDALFVGNPSAFKRVPQASRELFAAMVRNAPLKGNMLDWFERGGTGATLQVQELGEVNDLEPFRRLQRKMYGNRMRNLPVRLAKQYWRAARISTDLRESILRYAAYLDYLEQMKANGGRPKNFGASIREEVMALDDIKDRAWKLSNDLLGAYDEVSVTGQGLREHLIPFWSWNEVNMRRYKRLVQNAIQDERSMQLLGRGLAGGLAIKAPMVALKVGKFAVMATALWSVMAAWNHLMYPDEEDELPEDVRGRPHIIYGRDKDGSVRYFSRLGAVADALEWFGADIAPQYVADFLNGRRTVKEIAIEMAKGAPNKLVQGITPIGPKGLLEVITRRQLFPDFTRPRLIRDRGLYVAELIGAGPEYMALRRKITGGPPGKPYGESVWDTFGYKIDPLQVAYWDIRGEQRRWETKQGKASEGFWLSPRGSALYNLRLAARYKDSVSQEKYAKEYIALQGTLRGMRQSFERMAPLAGMSKEDQKAFIASLDSEQLRQLGKAERFYNTVLLGEGGRGAEKIIHNFASALAPGLDTTEIRLEVARQRGRAMGLRRVNRTAEADEAERTARELVNSVGGEKAFNRMIHDEWLDRRNKQATAGERPRMPRPGEAMKSHQEAIREHAVEVIRNYRKQNDEKKQQPTRRSTLLKEAGR